MSQHFNADYENLTPNEIASQVVMLELTRQEVDQIVHNLQMASKCDESLTAGLARVIDSGERIYSPRRDLYQETSQEDSSMSTKSSKNEYVVKMTKCTVLDVIVYADNADEAIRTATELDDHRDLNWDHGETKITITSAVPIEEA